MLEDVMYEYRETLEIFKNFEAGIERLGRLSRVVLENGKFLIKISIELPVFFVCLKVTRKQDGKIFYALGGRT